MTTLCGLSGSFPNGKRCCFRLRCRRILAFPEQINIAVSKPAEGVRQEAYVVYDTQKVPLAEHILAGQQATNVIVFSSTKLNVKALEKALNKLKIPAQAIHSDLEQDEREKVLRQFRNREINVLIATDILSRGIDIEGINLIINYDVPHDAEDYIHRIGRTARASSTGVAITFINEKEQRKFSRIEDFLEREIPKLPLPEFLGEGPAYTPGKRGDSSGRPKPFNKKKNRFKRKPKTQGQNNKPKS
jgi:ATP-dependent RNA helicase RhlE